MTDELTSPSLKSGNVLALLNTLYTSGFAMASSSTPLLKGIILYPFSGFSLIVSGKTLHTLYAVSFVVYVTNSICSWLHISFVVKVENKQKPRSLKTGFQGYVTSFPLNTWLVVSLVVTAVCGSMFTWLLLVSADWGAMLIYDYEFAGTLYWECVCPQTWHHPLSKRMRFAVWGIHWMDTGHLARLPDGLLPSFRHLTTSECHFLSWRYTMHRSPFSTTFLSQPADVRTLKWSYQERMSWRIVKRLQILSWPLVLSASSCTVSLIWRITVLYFSYKSEQRNDEIERDKV